MRMVLTHRLSNHLGALGVLLVEQKTHLLHRVQHATMHRFQSITHIRKRAANDHRHCIIEIRTPHLIFNVDWHNVAAVGGTAPPGGSKGNWGFLSSAINFSSSPCYS